MLNVKCEVVTRQSKKTGNAYTALEITFPNGYKKLVFMDSAEIYMVQSMSAR